MEGHPRAPAPKWMRPLLRCAAAYNVAWFVYMIGWPRLPFEMAQLPVPNYPSLWFTLAMVIGIFGVGYGLASTDPLRHWRLVLLGLLAKIGGPLGFLWAAYQGELPWVAGVAPLVNDVAWWLPMGLIVWAGLRSERQAAGPPATLSRA